MPASSPTPGWRVPLSDLVVDDELVGAVVDTIRSGWWSTGPRVEEFEHAFAEFCGARHAHAVANGTAALHLALLACGCGPGDEVIVPSLTFVAAANTVAAVGATPVFVDIVGSDDLNLDADLLDSLVTPRTKAIAVLHYAGFPCDMATVLEVAERHGLIVLEDAAHAPGAKWDGRSCGTLGRAGCFSFFSNKNLPIGEGGMVVTDDDEVSASLRLLRSHGMTTLTWDRHRGHASSYDVLLHGFNYRLDEVRAAMGLVQLRRLFDANAARGRIAIEYRNRLEGSHGIGVPFADRVGDDTCAHHLFVVVLPDGTDRESVRQQLATAGVQTSVHYPPIHTFTAFKQAAASTRLPRTEALAPRLLTLPLYPTMRAGQIDLVVDTLTDALAATAYV